MDDKQKLGLPSKKAIEESIKVVEGFRDMCRHQMELGYWATVDFPSKHHLNKILQMHYRNKNDLVESYGDGLVKHIYSILPTCRNYIAFLKGSDNKNDRNVDSK